MKIILYAFLLFFWVVMGSASLYADSDLHSEIEVSDTLPQLDFTTYTQQIFWALVTFGIMYAIMSYMILPRVLAIKSTRTHRINDNLENALKTNNDAKSIANIIDQRYAAISQKEHEIHKDVVLRTDKLAKKRSAELDLYKSDQYKEFDRTTSVIKENFDKEYDTHLASITQSILVKLGLEDKS